jgi:hypothetical protein
MEKFESAFLVAGIGVEPKVAGLAVEVAISESLGFSGKVRVKRVAVELSQVIVAGDAEADELKQYCKNLGSKLAALAKNRHAIAAGVEKAGNLPRTVDS